MELEQLTDEQIANLTPEQIEMLENDPDKLAEILGNQEKGTEEPNDEPEQEEETERANDAGEVDEEEEEEPVVLNKSGKGTIPYEKHKELRVENATLKEQLQSLQKTQAELESLKAQKAAASTPERRAEIQKKLTDRIATMKEDFPEIGESLSEVNTLIQDLAQEIREGKAASEAKAKEAEEQRARTINEQVQEAKENTPHLMHWETSDPDAWQEALMQDQILFNSSKWANKPIEERFKEVVRRVKSVMPEASEPKSETPPEKPEKVAEKAQAKLEKAVVKKPITLSDIHGGDTPASEAEQLQNLSPFELAQKLMKMPDHKAAAMRAELD